MVLSVYCDINKTLFAQNASKSACFEKLLENTTCKTVVFLCNFFNVLQEFRADALAQYGQGTRHAVLRQIEKQGKSVRVFYDYSL